MQLTNLTTVQFHKSLYQITDPNPAWFQRSPDDLPECSECGDVLTFVFAPRVDPQAVACAESYQTLVAIRCNCFLTDHNASGLACYKKLARQPIFIIPLSDL